MAGTPDDALPVPEPLATSGAGPASGPGRRAALAAVLVVGVLVVGLAVFVVTRKDGPADTAADVQSGEEQPPALYAVIADSIYELRADDGSVVRRVYQAPARRPAAGGDALTSLAASADGTTLYTDLAGEDQEKPDVVAVDVHTGAVRTVVVNGRLPGLSPDGRTLVFKRGTPMRPDAGLHLLDLVTGTERTIVVDAGALPVHDRRQPKSDTNYFPPRFSPDGRWIASGALAHDGLGLLGIDAGASPRLLPVPNAIDGGVGFWGDEVLYGASDAATSWNAGAPNVAFRVRAEPSPVPGIGGRGAPTTLVGGPAGSAGEVGAAGRELFSAPITLIPGDTAFAVMDVVPATSSQRARLVVTVIASGSSSGSGIAYGWTEGQAPKRLAENVRAIVLAPSRTPATVRTRPGVGTGPSSTTTGSVSTLAPGGSSPATTGTRPATATTTGLVER